MSSLLQEFAFQTRVRLFKWNVNLPTYNRSLRHQGQILFLIKNRLISTPAAFNNEFTTPISHIFPFNVECLSSAINIEKLAKDALLSTHQFLDHNNITALTKSLSEYLINNYSFGVENFSQPNNPKVVIVVEINNTRVLKGSDAMDEVEFEFEVEDQFNGETSSIDEEHIMRRLRNMLGVPVFCVLGPNDVSEPLGLNPVPGLDFFQGCDDAALTADDEATCAICLEGLSVGTCRKTPCSHVFHGDCIGQWLWRKRSCPMCRSQLV